MSAPIATNKKAYHNYFLLDRWECGIALEGSEVKSLRDRQVSFKDSFARVEKGQAFLYNLYIAPYGQAGHFAHDPDRVRKLLLHKKEIRKLTDIINQKNIALIPTKIYFNKRGLAKIELAVGQGKKMYDKRETIKNRDIDRDISRALKVYKKK